MTHLFSPERRTSNFIQAIDSKLRLRLDNNISCGSFHSWGSIVAGSDCVHKHAFLIFKEVLLVMHGADVNQMCVFEIFPVFQHASFLQSEFKRGRVMN